MITNKDKTITPTSSTNINSGIGITSATSIPPVANMDATDWTTMLMEMRILSA